MSSKRNRDKVQDARNAKKAEKGRVVNEKFEYNAPPPITAKTQPQKELFKALHSDVLVVAMGPAGTGKTFCSLGNAGDELRKGEIDKICISRPYVSMGNGIGFRPGSEAEKLMPFMLPMLDVLEKRLTKGGLETQIRSGNVEIVPMDTLRGRSFENAVVCIDEAQNTTVDEMKSIVTRIGEGSQLILMGDEKQKDIKGISGLEWVAQMIEKYNIGEASVIRFTIDDVVRSNICATFLRIMDTEASIS